MSDTIVDLAKVAQMFDAGWHVKIGKNTMGSYYAHAHHASGFLMNKVENKIGESVSPDFRELAMETAFETDDFTPEQTLTRLAYKVMGEII